MFSGSWKESTMEKIDIHIIDPNIDLNALHIALGSLYQDEITVEPADVIPILAAASLFQVCTNKHLLYFCLVKIIYENIVYLIRSLFYNIYFIVGRPH